MAPSVFPSTQRHQGAETQRIVMIFVPSSLRVFALKMTTTQYQPAPKAAASARRPAPGRAAGRPGRPARTARPGGRPAGALLPADHAEVGLVAVQIGQKDHPSL